MWLSLDFEFGVVISVDFRAVALKRGRDIFSLASVNNVYGLHPALYSTVTDFAKFRGLSTSVPRASAV